jgi:hypothetical protein
MIALKRGDPSVIAAWRERRIQDGMTERSDLLLQKGGTPPKFQQPGETFCRSLPKDTTIRPRLWACKVRIDPSRGLARAAHLHSTQTQGMILRSAPRWQLSIAFSCKALGSASSPTIVGTGPPAPRAWSDTVGRYVAALSRHTMVETWPGVLGSIK